MPTAAPERSPARHQAASRPGGGQERQAPLSPSLSGGAPGSDVPPGLVCREQAEQDRARRPPRWPRLAARWWSVSLSLSQSVNCSHFLGCSPGFRFWGEVGWGHVRLSGGEVAPGPTAPALAGLSQRWGDPAGFRFEPGRLEFPHEAGERSSAGVRPGRSSSTRSAPARLCVDTEPFSSFCNSRNADCALEAVWRGVGRGGAAWSPCSWQTRAPVRNDGSCSPPPGATATAFLAALPGSAGSFWKRLLSQA